MVIYIMIITEIFKIANNQYIYGSSVHVHQHVFSDGRFLILLLLPKDSVAHTRTERVIDERSFVWLVVLYRVASVVAGFDGHEIQSRDRPRRDAVRRCLCNGCQSAAKSARPSSERLAEPSATSRPARTHYHNFINLRNISIILRYLYGRTPM